MLHKAGALVLNEADSSDSLPLVWLLNNLIKHDLILMENFRA